MPSLNPLLLYVHIPYCVHKCHYCDFNSHERSAIDWPRYEEALLAELTRWSKETPFAGRELQSIFFGGGTPSLAPAGLIKGVIDEAKGHFAFAEGVEVSLEANPGTIDRANFKGFREAGVNRLSIGVQSLNDVELKWLERIHDRKAAVAALKAGREAGFENINLDLIYGLPGQSLDAWFKTLDQAIELEVEHLSCYQLTVEPHTKLAANIHAVVDRLPDDELALEFFYQTRERLAEAGYEAYEVSNFARSGLKCQHNDGYWLYRDYIGIGAGASGKWDYAGDDEGGGVVRYTNIRNPERYCDAALKDGRAINSEEKLPKETAEAEAVWQGLRRTSGISNHWFTERFGSDIEKCFGNKLAPWLAEGRLVWSGDRLFLTEKGVPFADAVAGDLF